MVLLLFVNAGRCGHRPAPTASVEVGATDTAGALIAGASVTATAVDKGYSRNATTSPDGEYTLLALLPGIYDIKIEKAGFTPQRQSSVQLTVGQTLHVDFVMQVAVITETLNITTEPPVIDSERTQQANTVNEHYIRNLPINRRDYLSFTLLAPGVNDATSIVDSSDFRVVQTPSSGLSFYGSNGRGNSVTVDGAEANDLYSGVRATLSQRPCRSFRSIAANYAAELRWRQWRSD
jgi:hypothetical protein